MYFISKLKVKTKKARSQIVSHQVTGQARNGWEGQVHDSTHISPQTSSQLGVQVPGAQTPPSDIQYDVSQVDKQPDSYDSPTNDSVRIAKVGGLKPNEIYQFSMKYVILIVRSLRGGGYLT